MIGSHFALQGIEYLASMIRDNPRNIHLKFADPLTV